MKKIFICTMLCLMTFCAKAQLKSTSTCINGIWGPWETNYSFCGTGRVMSDLIIYYCNHHPSHYIMRLMINDGYLPDKKTIKKHYKTGEWYVFHGTLEWSVPQDESQTITNFVKSFPLVTSRTLNYYKSDVIVKIYPHKHYPKRLVMNIFFQTNQDMGIGLDIVTAD